MAPSRASRPNKPKKKPKEPAFKVEDVGKMGQGIFADIVKGVGDLVPINGRIYIEVDLEIEDENVFKDDELRKSKLIIEVNLEQPDSVKITHPTINV
jgi:hypothetical protein